MRGTLLPRSRYRIPYYLYPLFTLIAWAWTSTFVTAVDVANSPAVLSVVNRSVTQDQGAWVVDYRLQYNGKSGAVVTPEDITIKAKGWVSNSRVASHALPRWSSLEASCSSELSATCDVITVGEEANRCRERLATSIWIESQGQATTRLIAANFHKKSASDTSVTKPTERLATLPFLLPSQTIIRVQLRFEHQHILYGEYDPLLGTRRVSLTIGLASVDDVIALDREQYLAQPNFHWEAPPTERCDFHHVASGPQSLHLEAHVLDHQYYRYLDRPVRYNTKMRLRFWYFIAAGTEGDCKVRVTQCKDTPIAWRMLGKGNFEECLKTVGRWTKVERTIQTDPEATMLGLEFKIIGDTEVGEMWIDNVSLEPAGFEGLRRP